MTLPREDVDPEGLLEYSVVFSDRSLNHMSQKFVSAMQELLGILRDRYNAHAAVVVPGGGSFAMEAVARQFADDKKVLVLRNGFFSYRWTQIIEAGNIASEHSAVLARLLPEPGVASPESGAAAPELEATASEPTATASEPAAASAKPGAASPAADSAGEGEYAADSPRPQLSPAPLVEVQAAIGAQQPDVVFAPHVETASGVLLSPEYITAVAAATHEVGGIFVLDCVASGTEWVDMEQLGVDVLISAPQKGWSGSPGAGYVMLNQRARGLVERTQSSSFAMDLQKWANIATAYERGHHGYHATIATDTLLHNLEVMREAQHVGLDVLCDRQRELGRRVRELFASYGFVSLAAPDCAAASVVVVHAAQPGVNYVSEFAAAGVQIAGGVPLMVGEPNGLSTFRIGLFGLDKWEDVEATVARLEKALQQVTAV